MLVIGCQSVQASSDLGSISSFPVLPPLPMSTSYTIHSDPLMFLKETSRQEKGCYCYCEDWPCAFCNPLTASLHGKHWCYRWEEVCCSFLLLSCQPMSCLLTNCLLWMHKSKNSPAWSTFLIGASEPCGGAGCLLPLWLLGPPQTTEPESLASGPKNLHLSLQPYDSDRNRDVRSTDLHKKRKALTQATPEAPESHWRHISLWFPHEMWIGQPHPEERPRRRRAFWVSTDTDPASPISDPVINMRGRTLRYTGFEWGWKCIDPMLLNQ